MREGEKDPAKQPGPNEKHGPDADLKAELEALRDLFQKELDRVKNEPQDEAPVQAPQEKPGAVCECCGEAFDPDEDAGESPYCEGCLQKMRTRPIHAAASLLTLLAFFLAAVGLYLFSDSITEWRQLLAAQRAVQETRLLDAADMYEDVFFSKNTRDSVSLYALKSYTDLCLSLGEVHFASTLTDAWFPGPALKLPWNTKYRDVATVQAQFKATETAAIDIFNEYDDYTDAAVYEEADARLCALRADDAYSPVVVEYLRYLLMKAADQSTETQMKQLERLQAVDRDGVYKAHVLCAMIELSGARGDLESARAYYNAAMALNAQDQNAQEAYVRALRRQSTPDAAAIFSVAQSAKVSAPIHRKQIWLRFLAVSDLLRADTAQAFQEMHTYAQFCTRQELPLTMEEWNLYALCAAAAGQTAVYEQVKTMLEDAKQTLSPLVQKVYEGTLRVEQAFQTDGGDIA